MYDNQCIICVSLICSRVYNSLRHLPSLSVKEGSTIDVLLGKDHHLPSKYTETSLIHHHWLCQFYDGLAGLAD